MEHRKGRTSEEFIHKFFKGELVSEHIDFCDLETKKYLYEIKSMKIYHEGKKDKRIRFGRYQIMLDNHKKIKESADEKNKKAKYVFVLVIGETKVFKVLSWESVDRMIIENGKIAKKASEDRERCHLSINCIW